MGISTAGAPDFFEQVKTFQSFETASGPVQVPVLYRDVTSMWAFFEAPVDKVRRILPSNKLKPVLVGRAKAIYGFAAFEYKDTTVGAYNEVGTGPAVLYNPPVNLPLLPAIFDRAFQVAFYVHHLPVTTKIAYDIGVEIWGYPKFLADITFEETTDIRRCILRGDGKHILTFEVKKGGPAKPNRWNFDTFTVKGDEIFRIVTNSKGLAWTSRKGDSARLTLGDHPVAEELRSLEIGERPLKTIYYPYMQTILNAASKKYPLPKKEVSAILPRGS